MSKIPDERFKRSIQNMTILELRKSYSGGRMDTLIKVHKSRMNMNVTRLIIEETFWILLGFSPWLGIGGVPNFAWAFILWWRSKFALWHEVSLLWMFLGSLWLAGVLVTLTAACLEKASKEREK